MTVVLLVIAVVPWMFPLFKSFEFPGGWKVELQDMQAAKDKAGLIASQPVARETDHAYQLIADKDPNLALAGLRIEIEKRLLQIAEANDIQARRSTVGQLLNVLSARQIFTPQERGVLADLIGILNSGVHGAAVDKQAAEVAIDVGTRLLATLDEKIPRKA